MVGVWWIRLKDGMVFNLCVGLQDVPLSKEEKKGSGAESMETFSAMIAGQYCLCLFCVVVTDLLHFHALHSCILFSPS